MSSPPVHAIVWDFDNTLVDTRARNRSVTRRIVASLTSRDPDEFDSLRTQREYDRAVHRTQNWQDLYRTHFGLDAGSIRTAGGMWTALQLEDPTPTTWFDGVADVVRELRSWPQAIVSMNTSGNILSALERARLASAFELVVGCEEVEHHRQKPEPDGLLHCLETLTALEAGTVFYVGDHPIDAECARNANRALGARGSELRVVSIGAAYGAAAAAAHRASGGSGTTGAATLAPDAGGDETIGWSTPPDHLAGAPADVLAIVRRLAGSAPSDLL